MAISLDTEIVEVSLKSGLLFLRIFWGLAKKSEVKEAGIFVLPHNPETSHIIHQALILIRVTKSEERNKGMIAAISG